LLVEKMFHLWYTEEEKEYRGRGCKKGWQKPPPQSDRG
jgi:hypothetical protein